MDGALVAVAPSATPASQSRVSRIWLRLMSTISPLRTKIPLALMPGLAPKLVMALSRMTRFSTAGTQIAP